MNCVPPDARMSLPSSDPREWTERSTHSGPSLMSAGIEPVWIRQLCRCPASPSCCDSRNGAVAKDLLRSLCIWAEIQSSHATLETTESVQFKKSIVFCVKFLQKIRRILISLWKGNEFSSSYVLSKDGPGECLFPPCIKESIVSSKYFFQKQCTNKF